MPTPSEYGPLNPGITWNRQTPNTRFLISLFYQLRKQFPADLQYVKVLKGEINVETGKVTDPERIYVLKAVISPAWITTEYLAKLIGRVERLESVFLIKTSDLPVEVTTTDYFVHNGRKYKNLSFEDMDGALTALFGETVK